MKVDNHEQYKGQLINADSSKHIDWDTMHSVQQARMPFFGKDSTRWNRYSISPSLGEIDQNYIDQLLPRLLLSPEVSVLDVGCGNGGISIALANRVRQVIALDFSTAALKSLERKTKELTNNNITLIHADFSQIEVGKDVEMCNVVLASRCLPMSNLRQSLTKINLAARRLCYVVCSSSDNELTQWICSKTGIVFRPFPEYIITPNVLYTMGIHANVEIFSVRGTYRFNDLDEAWFFAMFGYDIKDKSTCGEITKLILSKLIPEDGGYKYNYQKQFALIWWQKEG